MEKQQIIELLNSLTLDEKIFQLFQGNAPMFGQDGAITGVSSQEWITDEVINNMGSALNIFTVERLRKIQENHLKHNKVPLIFMADVIYGYNTVFPVALSQACSFNTDLVKKIAQTAAREAAASGINITFSPMLDITRDARWGRCAEGYGEDTELTSRCGKAAVEGYQGDDLTAFDTIGACLKHFAAYGAPYDGRDYNAVDMSERKLRGEYLPAYKAAVDAEAAMVMASFNTVNGVPSSINKRLLKDLLRDEWGFDGVIISDYSSIYGCTRDGSVNDDEQCAQLAMEATMDIDMMDHIYPVFIKRAIEHGRLSEKQLDDAVLRVLELKNKLGLLDDPYRYLKDNSRFAALDMDAHYRLALDAVCEGAVLLKNERNTLPLDGGKKIAFIGPFVHKNRVFSTWSNFIPGSVNGMSLAEAVQKHFPSAACTFSHGCPFITREQDVDGEQHVCYGNERQYFDEAIECAKNAEIVVMAIGEDRQFFGEARSRAIIDLPQLQKELFDAVYEVNPNIVTLLYNGRPLDITEISEKSLAVLDMWYPGSAGQEAAALMLFGERTPSGKLAMSFPRTSSQTPLYYSELPTNRRIDNETIGLYGLRYHDINCLPLYRFGDGLSYTEFEYSPVTLDAETMRSGETIKASVKVKNIGKIDAYEIVQLYIRDPKATLVSRPLKQLKDFKKVYIKAGETVNVEFELNEEMLKFYDYNMNYTAEPGEIQVFISPDSKTTEYASFQFV